MSLNYKNFRWIFIRMKKYIIIIIFIFSSLYCQAKSYKFNINNPISNVTAARSTVPGTKMVEVITYGSSADKAIDKAMMDAVIASTFYGITGNNFIENIPPVLVGGKDQYNSHKNFFDAFFKKGEFMKFVSRVNSTYPTGTNNVSTSKGRKITIYLIVDWKRLEDYFKSQGLTTQSSLLNFD